MHPLIASELRKCPSIGTWQTHRADCQKQVAARRALAAPAFDYVQRTTDKQNKWVKEPSNEICEEWMLAIALQTAAVAVQQAVVADEQARYLELLRGGFFGGLWGGAAKLSAVIADAENAWQRKRELVLKEDAQRSAELGETVVSSQTLAAVDRGLEACGTARGYLSQGDIQNAVGAAGTATGCDL